jgi:hypothetical protein
MDANPVNNRWKLIRGNQQEPLVRLRRAVMPLIIEACVISGLCYAAWNVVIKVQRLLVTRYEKLRTSFEQSSPNPNTQSLLRQTR